MLLSVVCVVALLGSCMSVPAPRNVITDLVDNLKGPLKDALHEVLANGEETIKQKLMQYLMENAASFLGKRDTDVEELKVLRRNAIIDALKEMLKAEAVKVSKDILGTFVSQLGKRSIESDLIKAFILPKVNELVDGVLHNTIASVEAKLTELLNKL